MSAVLDVKSAYMERAHNPRELIETFRLLRRHHPTNLQFDTLVGTGLSGAIVLPHLARALRKSYLVVRKDKDGSHSDYPAEGVLGGRWLFVDDLIASGSTFNRCVNVVQSLPRKLGSDMEPQLVGAFLYSEGSSSYPAVLSDAEVKRYDGGVLGEELYADRFTFTKEYKVREKLCTGCEPGCAGVNCRGPYCEHCWDWCEGTCRRALREKGSGARVDDERSYDPVTVTWSAPSSRPLAA